MTSPILLTGGTGTLGRLVAPLLRDAVGRLRVVSRRTQAYEDGMEYVTGDLSTSQGIAAAVAGIGTIVHCAGSAKGDGEKAEVLVKAAAAAGVGHLLYISVVGAERLPVVSRLDRAMFGYFAAKRAAERLVADSGIGWTTVRATQFHDLTFLTVSQLAKLPVIPVPTGFRFQPVDAGEVATRLAELALGPPSGLVADLAGPQVYAVDELIRSYLRSTDRRRLILPVKVPGPAARALRAGANLALDHAIGQRTWEDFLADRLPSTADGWRTPQ